MTAKKAPAATIKPSGNDDHTRDVPLVAHVLFHLGTGGLENGVINLINHMPRDAYQHAIVCIKGATEFQRRLTRPDVRIVTLNKREGIEPGSYTRAWRALRELRPAIVHTRNLAALEMQLPAALAGIPVRVHSEHGRDGLDSDGTYARYNLLRKAFRPLVHKYVALSADLQRWMVDKIAIDSGRIDQIYNGVNLQRFTPVNVPKRSIGPDGFFSGATFVVGAIGRVVTIKDHETLIRGFARLCADREAQASGFRLVLVGDGPLRRRCVSLSQELRVESRCWFAGERTDVELILKSLDVFCLTSRNEGINNTVLEAMSSGLPVVATAVGGNKELVLDGVCGRLVPACSPADLAQALGAYCQDPELGRQHGRAARQRVEQTFSLDTMVSAYMRLYDRLLADRNSSVSVQWR